MINEELIRNAITTAIDGDRLLVLIVVLVNGDSVELAVRIDVGHQRVESPVVVLV